MKKIVILTPAPFSKRDYDRFGIDILKRNFLVQVLDCAAWINQEYLKLYYFLKTIQYTHKDTTIISLCVNLWTFFNFYSLV